MKMDPVNGERNAVHDAAMTELKFVTESRNELVSVVGGRHEALNADNGSFVSYLSQPSVEVQPLMLPLSFLDELTVDGNYFMGNAQPMETTEPGWDPETTEKKLEEFNNQSEVSEAESSEGEVEFVPLKCDKRKNPDYLLEEGLITTRNNRPVLFQVKGGKAGQEVYITMQYSDLVLKQSPVKACKKHRSENTDELPPEFCFRIPNKECKYELLDGHPTAIIPIKKENPNVAVSFLCLNSCHRNQGKLTDLIMTLFDPASGNAVKKQQHFSLRVCMNVKRDHKELKRLATDTLEEAPVMKCRKQEMEEMAPRDDSKPVCHPPTLPGSQNTCTVLTPEDYYLIKLSAEQREALIPLFKLIGVDDLHPVCSVKLPLAAQQLKPC